MNAALVILLSSGLLSQADSDQARKEAVIKAMKVVVEASKKKIAEDAAKKEDPLKESINNDWSLATYVEGAAFGGKATSSTTRLRMLSLRPGEKWDGGTAWILGHYYRESDSLKGRGKDAIEYMEAYKGVYEVFSHKTDQDLLVLKLGFTRKFLGKLGSSGDTVTVRWEQDASFEPIGAAMLFDRHGTAPFETFELTMDRVFFVDEKGAETIVRSTPRTFTEKLSGLGQVRDAYQAEFASTGEVLPFQQGDALSDLFFAKGGYPPSYRAKRGQRKLDPQKLLDEAMGE